MLINKAQDMVQFKSDNILPPPAMAAALPEVSSLNREDNMFLYTSKTAQELLEERDVDPEALTWPPDVPDLSPIKHPPDVSEQARTTGAPPCNPQNPRDLLPKTYCQTPQDTPGGFVSKHKWVRAV